MSETEPSAPAPLGPTLTIEQAMYFLQVSRSTIERRIADKTLKATRKFGHPRILTDCDDWGRMGMAETESANFRPQSGGFPAVFQTTLFPSPPKSPPIEIFNASRRKESPQLGTRQ